MAMYSDPGTLTGGSAKTFLMQHLQEVAIDHHNGIFADEGSQAPQVHQCMSDRHITLE
jgi:hypothetical protein